LNRQPSRPHASLATKRATLGRERTFSFSLSVAAAVAVSASVVTHSAVHLSCCHPSRRGRSRSSSSFDNNNNSKNPYETPARVACSADIYICVCEGKISRHIPSIATR